MESTRDFLADRSAWVAKGRPADPADPHWAGVLAATAAREAAEQAGERPFVAPLVRLGW